MGLRLITLEQEKAIVFWKLKTAFEKASSRTVPYSIGPRRPGDIGKCFADPTKAEKELEWKAKKELKRCVLILGDGK